MIRNIIIFLLPFFLYANYSDNGPYEVVTTIDNFTLTTGQLIEYTLYKPAEINHTTQVILVHAF